jgi:hypothetical protein
MNRASIRHFVLPVIAIAMAAASAGCAYGPTDGSQVGPGQTMEWEGFATAPSVQVLIQAQDSSGNWDTVATATSDTQDGNAQLGQTVFDRQIYQWDNARVVIPEGFFVNGQARVRAVEGADTQYPMWMFDNPGLSCLENDFETAYFGHTIMNTEQDDQTCSRATNGGQDRNFITVHH